MLRSQVAVRSLVDAEMDNFEPRDYLASLQPVPPVSFPRDSILWNEMERVSKDPTSKINGMDLSRYARRSRLIHTQHATDVQNDLTLSSQSPKRG